MFCFFVFLLFGSAAAVLLALTAATCCLACNFLEIITYHEGVFSLGQVLLHPPRAFLGVKS